MKKHCDNCIYGKIETAQDGWQFYCCVFNQPEGKSKYVKEIEKCPLPDGDDMFYKRPIIYKDIDEVINNGK